MGLYGLNRTMPAAGATSVKSASDGINGARDAKTKAFTSISSNEASSGTDGAREINVLSFLTGAEEGSLPAKRIPDWSMRTAAKIVIVVFIFVVV